MKYVARLLDTELTEVCRTGVIVHGDEPLRTIAIPVIEGELKALFGNGEEVDAMQVRLGQIRFFWNGERYDVGDGLIYVYEQEEGKES